MVHEREFVEVVQYSGRLLDGIDPQFRGARAGQVVCEREKSLMAEPWVPPDDG